MRTGRTDMTVCWAETTVRDASLGRIRSVMEGLRAMNVTPDLAARSVAEEHLRSGDGGDCIEVADGFEGVMPVRDSKDPAVPP